MINITKNYIVDENQKRIAVQIPIDEFDKIVELIENYGLAKLIDETNEDEVLSVKEAKRFYKAMKKNVGS